jgi:hypothetical protein
MDLPPKDCLILPPEKLIENLLNTEAFYDTVSTIVFSWLGPAVHGQAHGVNPKSETEV